VTTRPPSHAITPRLTAVRAEIAETCARVGRDPALVTIVAVTKGHPIERARDALAAGLADLGESRAQELAPKARALADEGATTPDGEAPRWHFIGHLQRNKVAGVLPLLASLHSLDSTRLLAAIEATRGWLGADGSRAASAPLPCYLEVNVAGDPAKHGVPPEGLPALLHVAQASEAVTVRGLMTVAPEGTPEAARPHFRALAELAREHGLAGLSIGMTGDYRVAIEEGATVVRIGRALLGERPAGAG
jgi:pyridoxal phosphate enzyme (YggS family)